MKTVDEALSFADRMYTKSSFAGVLAAEVRRLREENERKNRLFTDAVSALAAIDAALGMPEDGCNSTDKTITAIKLMHAVRVDDEKEITRLTEENERLRERAKTIGELEQLAARSNNNLLVENDRLREENERLRKDAERYQWFRVSENWRDSGPFDDLYEIELDSAIDAARGAK
jgi:hypothetical protein